MYNHNGSILTSIKPWLKTYTTYGQGHPSGIILVSWDDEIPN